MILKSDVLDILFENRNKMYGAYTLRKFYPERIKTSLIIMLCLVIAFCLFAFLNKNKPGELTVFELLDPELVKVNMDKKIAEPKPKTSPTQKTIFKSQKLVSTIKMVKAVSYTHLTLPTIYSV